MHIGSARLQEIILDVYDTALDPSRWPIVLTKISESLGANGTFIFELDQTGDARRITAPYFSNTYDPRVVAGYLAAHNSLEIEDQDTFARHSLATDGIDLIRDDVLAATEAELLSRANAKQLLEFGIRYRAGALLNKTCTSIDRFAVQFSAAHGPITADERLTMKAILPHVAKALNINRPVVEFAKRNQLVFAGLDMMRIGICIVRPFGDIVYKNLEFDRQLSEHRVFGVDARGRLTFRDAAAGSAAGAYLQDLLAHGCHGARPWKEAIVPDENERDHCLCIEICPLPSPSILNGERGVHLIYSFDTSLGLNLDATAIAKRFDLTATEQSVLTQVLDGATNSEIAEMRGKSIETINSQVKSILGKTGTQNRAKLVRVAINMSFGFLRIDPFAASAGGSVIGH